MSFRAIIRLAKEKNQNKPPYFSGGFDIMKKLHEEQSGRKKKDPSYFTGGFGILKKWQQEHSGYKPLRDYETGGFDILKQWQRGK